MTPDLVVSVGHWRLDRRPWLIESRSLAAVLRVVLSMNSTCMEYRISAHPTVGFAKRIIVDSDTTGCINKLHLTS
jgi:hypothetical protein